MNKLERRLIYFSPLRLGSYGQRPHFFVDFLRKNFFSHVLWVNPYPTRFPNWRDIKRSTVVAGGESCVQDIRVLDIFSLPFEPWPVGRWLNRKFIWGDALRELKDFANSDCCLGIGKPSQLACWALDHLPRSFSFFDFMDDFPSFYSGASKKNSEACMDFIGKNVDVAFCSSSFLYQKARQCFEADAVKVLNAYPMRPLPDRKSTDAGRFIAGYIGGIHDWFDWGIVIRLAEELPSVEFRLIGPCDTLPKSHLPKNIVMLGPCHQSEAPKHAAEFSVGLIPFKQNSLTQAVDPIKYYEYRALGVPVWTTEFGEMLNRLGENGVFSLSGQNLDVAGLFIKTQAFRDEKDDIFEFRNANDWSHRFSEALPPYFNGDPN